MADEKKKYFVEFDHFRDPEKIGHWRVRIRKWFLALFIVSIVAVNGILITYQTFNPWLKRVEGWVQNHDERLAFIEAEASVTAAQLAELQQAELNGTLTIVYHPNASGVDAHVVDGLLINYGTEPASNVRVEVIWIVDGYVLSKTIVVGVVPGRSIITFSETFYFEGEGLFDRYQITWT